jgi:hypothetical protein|tara:strand:- start:192 stop:407 length:216 start_codon:yes stop_codon:yes gene_type:complete
MLSCVPYLKKLLKKRRKLMNTEKWKSVAIRREIVDLASEIGKKTDRPTSSVFAHAIKNWNTEIELLEELNG